MIRFGSAWYPEHWPEERWPVDVALMRRAGMNVVRIGEFAWSRMQPCEDRVELDWLARAIDCAVEAGLEVVLCTPTATPPSWLTRAYPDILPIRDAASGTIQPHGQRGHYDPANETYRRYCERICEQLGERFGQHPGVIGWQIDNEFWTMASNPASLQAFRSWLQSRYHNLQQLNEIWSTSFWSQEYFSWEDIQPPLDYPNPGLYLAWYQFHSWLIADFQRVQVEALRQHVPERQWITHNFHPFDDFDRALIADDLDLVSWDAYVMGERLALDPAASGLDCDRLRGLHRRNIWIMETLPGFVNWRPVNRHFAPGETRSMAWHLIGHGADAVLYWQWRSAPTNQEQYHGCLLQQDGQPRPVYEEVAEVGAEFARCSELLAGTAPRNSIALVDRWVDRQILKKQPHHHQYEPRSQAIDAYRAFQDLGHGLDVFERLREPLPHRLVVAPLLHAPSNGELALLRRYVEHGGHLLLGPRCAMKDAHNRLRPTRQPGPLAELIGASVREFYALPEPVSVQFDDRPATVRYFAEWWEPQADDVDVVASYGEEDPWLAGRPALLSRSVGQGRISVLTGCGDTACWSQVAGWAARQAGCHSLLPVPAGVEVLARYQDADHRLLVVINHNDAVSRVPLSQSCQDELSGARLDGELLLEPFGVALLREL